ncbi:MAG: hypothetical protein CME27_03975 [Gemmatimonadetes bacterium]|nr:hypothetical protein [Gemmatimonadota bacterium]
MRLYEVVYILDASLDEAGASTKLEKFHELATVMGGEVSAVDHWGPRQLAYPIKKVSVGYYVVAHFTAVAEALPEFERLLKLDGEVLRYLLIINEGEPTSGASIMADLPIRASHDDEDDEDEDEDDELTVEDEDEESRDPTSAPPEFAGARGRRRRMEGPRVIILNYKDVETLSHFITDQGKILPKRTTKVTARFQRELGSAVKRARYLALLPYMQRQDG